MNVYVALILTACTIGIVVGAILGFVLRWEWLSAILASIVSVVLSIATMFGIDPAGFMQGGCCFAPTQAAVACLAASMTAVACGLVRRAAWVRRGRCFRCGAKREAERRSNFCAWCDGDRAPRFRVCPSCGYDLIRGPDQGCPECGWNRSSASTTDA